MTTNDSFVHVHVLWGASSALTNAGQSGGQKTVRFNGSERARMSSQALKRPTRIAFGASLAGTQRAVRSRDYWRHASDRLVAEHGWDRDAAIGACEMLHQVIGGGDGDGALFLRGDALEHCVALAIEHADAIEAATEPAALEGKPTTAQKAAHKEAVTAAKAARKSLKKSFMSLLDAEDNIDIAFNGRMVASVKSANVDAAVTVADSLGVGVYRPSIDYFSAIEDLPHDDRDGAESAMIGERERGSALYYRYALVNRRQLGANLPKVPAGELGDHLVHWVRNFVEATPVSQRTSTGTNAWPVAVMIEVKDSSKGNLYVKAYSKPVSPRNDEDDADENIAAIDRMTGAWANLTGAYESGVAVRLLAPGYDHSPTAPVEAVDTYDSLMAWLRSALEGA
jgi:CRISPR system Cascade subunit CasC